MAVTRAGTAAPGRSRSGRWRCRAPWRRRPAGRGCPRAAAGWRRASGGTGPPARLPASAAERRRAPASGRTGPGSAAAAASKAQPRTVRRRPVPRPDRYPCTVAAGLRGSARAACAAVAAGRLRLVTGRLAQRESTRFTPERSTVRSCQRPPTRDLGGLTRKVTEASSFLIAPVKRAYWLLVTIVIIPPMAIDVWADSVQTVAVALGAGAAIFAWRQVRLARHGGGGANILDLWGFLQSEVARGNRRILYQTASTKGPFVAGTDLDGPHSWDVDEIEAALHVAQICSTVGALAKHEYVPLEVLQDEWGSMIVRTSGPQSNP